MQLYPEYVKAYLDKQTTGHWKLEWAEKKGINNIIVIPAIEEFENLKSLLSSLAYNLPNYFSETLVICVVNNNTAHSDEVKESNNKSLKLLRSIIREDNSDDFYIQEVINSGLGIALVDASSGGKELSEKDSGVGFARKIGLDLALTTFDYSTKKKKILIWLDADCTVDENYITTIVEEFNNKNYSAAIVNFRHDVSGSSKFTEAIIPYEIFLRYYVLGLVYANSPYAFHTIGSTIAIDHNAYIKTGGMNKKKAGEDFYFLQKVVKNFKINKINSTSVYPSCRHSWRVPFGTGKSVKRFLSDRKDEYQLNDPLIFDILKKWLILFNNKNNFNTDYFMIEAGKIDKELRTYIIHKKFPVQWDRILKNTKNRKQLQFQKHIWFDGFKTFKLVHHLRDNGYPRISMFDAIDQLFLKTGTSTIQRKNKDGIPSLDIQKEYLYKLREIENN